MNKTTKLLLAGVMSLCSGMLAAEQFAVIGRADKAPVIDGRLDDACYKRSMPLTGFTYAISMESAKEQTELRLVYDDQYLYGALSADQKNIASLPQLTQSKNKKDCWYYDSAELFFAHSPTTMKQFMFDYSGSYAVFDCDMNASQRFKLNPNSKIKVAAGRTGKGWQLEFAIPRNELPKGDLKFQVVRNHRGKGHSCWGRLPEINWRDVTKYNTLKLAKTVPGMTFNKLPEMLLKSTLSLKLDAKQPLDITVTASGKEYKAKSTNGKVVTVGYKVLSDKKDVVLQIKSPKNDLLYRYRYALPQCKLEMSPRNLKDNNLLLASGVDLTAAIFWNSKHNLPNRDRNSGSRYKLDNSLIFEVPSGITVINGRKIGEKMVDGKRIVIYEQKNKFAYNAPGWIGTQFKSTLPSGSRGKFRYKLQWDGGVQSWQEIKYEVISIKPAPMPKKFINGFYAFWPRTVAEAEKISRIGINTFTIRGYDNNMINLSLALQKAGYFVKRAEYFWPGTAQNGTRGFVRWSVEDRRARARDIDGYYIPNGSGYLLSPTYRGKFYDEDIRKEIEFCKKAKISYFPFDMEGQVQHGAEKGDFSLRTVEMFKQHFTKTWPDKKYIEPQVFERNPEKYPFYHTAWVEFKCDQWADFFLEMKKRFAEGIGKDCRSVPFDGILFTEWSIGTPYTEEGRNKMLRNRKFFEVFNVIEYDFYTSADCSIRQFNMRLEQIEKVFPGLNLDFIITPSPYALSWDEYYNSNAPDYPDRFKYLAMETYAFGCIGMQTYYYSLADLHTMRQLSEAARILVKIEDIVLNGKRFKLTTNIPRITIKDRFHGKIQTLHNQERVFAKGLKYGNKDLITVSEYRTYDKLDVTVNYAPNRKVQLRDVETDQIIGRMNANDKSFRVTITPDRRCRMILAEPCK